jgi:hypothetical protein
MRANEARITKAFASVSIGGASPANSVVPLMGKRLWPNRQSPKIFIEIDEVSK